MNMASKFLALFPLTFALALGGCASNPADDSAQSAEAQLNELDENEPVTIDNLNSHGAIRAIEAEVSKIEGLPLVEESLAGCAYIPTKFQAGDQVRKVTMSAVEEAWRSASTVYFREDGSLLLYSAKETAVATDGTEEITETRIYFDATGKELLQIRAVGESDFYVPGYDEAYHLSGESVWDDFFFGSCGEGEPEGEGRGG